MRPWRRAVVILLAPLVLRCSHAAALAPDPGNGGGGGSASAILFIGNSLTEANDLPGRVQDLARDAGAPIDVSSLVSGGFSLEDHLAGSQLLPRLRSRSWAVVVMQQGPSTLPESRAALIRDASAIAREVRAGGGRPALLLVWPLPGQRAADVSASYRAAAAATDSLLLPAGDAWQAAAARDRSLVLTGPDGYHPSPLGTWLAALTIHCTLEGRLPTLGLEVERQRAQTALSADQARVLHESACAPAAP